MILRQMYLISYDLLSTPDENNPLFKHITKTTSEDSNIPQ